MGSFDNDLGTPFADRFREGEPVRIDDMRPGPVIPTSYGESQVVLLTIDGELYSMFGQGVLRQALSKAPGDFPRTVKLIRQKTKGGTDVKLFVPVEQGTTVSAFTPQTDVPVPTGDDDIPF